MIDFEVLALFPQDELNTRVVPTGTILHRGRGLQGFCKVVFNKHSSL